MQFKHKTRKNKKNTKLFSRVATAGAIPVVAIAVELASMGNFRMEQTAHALTYQEYVDVQFTFQSAISVSLSSDLNIYNLSPGSASDSNIIDVSIGSNNDAGYRLYSTVGSSSSSYTDLRLTPTNSTNVFSSISSSAATLANFSDNKWGYSYSTDSGSSWINGDYNVSSAGYGGLPLYTTTGVKLVETSTAGTSNVKFKIGAKASASQIAGNYSNVVNFIGVGNVIETSYTFNFVDDSGEATGLPSTLTGTTQNALVTLPDQIPTRNNYTFKGWCSVAPSGSTCPGTLYRPRGAYAIDNPSSTYSTTLHAVWATDLISFKIGYTDGWSEPETYEQTYFAEEGMTWEEWINSEYNTYHDVIWEDPETGGINYRFYDTYSGSICYFDYSKQDNESEATIMDNCYDGEMYTSGYWYTGGTITNASDTIISGWNYNLSGSCLTGDHMITMGDGTEKRLDEIKVGDKVLSYDWSTMTLIPKKVIYSDAEDGKTHTEYDKWTYSDGTVIKTVHRHEFYNVEAKCFKYMSEWQTGEHSYKKDGTKPALVSHELIKKTVRHYKITLEGGTNFFANGLLTGDRHNPKNIVL